jgi:hypothetical protein
MTRANLFLSLFLIASLVFINPNLSAQRRGGGGGGGGGNATRSTANSSVNRGNNANVNRNVNQNANVNRNVNVNQNVNVNRNVNVNTNYHGGGYYGGGGCCYHPVAAAAAITATAMVTAAVIGSVVNQPPAGCVSTIVNGLAYQQCGSTWYQPQMSGTSTTYVVVNAPR